MPLPAVALLPLLTNLGFSIGGDLLLNAILNQAIKKKPNSKFLKGAKKIVGLQNIKKAPIKGALRYAGHLGLAAGSSNLGANLAEKKYTPISDYYNFSPLSNLSIFQNQFNDVQNPLNQFQNPLSTFQDSVNPNTNLSVEQLLKALNQQ